MTYFLTQGLQRDSQQQEPKPHGIVNMALRPHFESILVAHMKEHPFALAVDGSNDNGLQKMNPLTVQIFDLQSGLVCTKFLDMCLTSGSAAGTAEKIFEAMENALECRGILWENFIGLSVDNTSVNIGKHNSIKSQLFCGMQVCTSWDVHVTLFTILLKKPVKLFAL